MFWLYSREECQISLHVYNFKNCCFGSLLLSLEVPKSFRNSGYLLLNVVDRDEDGAKSDDDDVEEDKDDNNHDQ